MLGHCVRFFFVCSNNFSSALIIYIKSDHLDRYVSYQGWLSSLFLFHMLLMCDWGTAVAHVSSPESIKHGHSF